MPREKSPDPDSKVTIKIPRPLYDRLKSIIVGTGFNSVTDFVVYVMRDLAASPKLAEDLSLTKDEVQAIRRRLENLGYL